MLFALKNPLKRKLSAQDLHHSRENLARENPSLESAFIGASLLDKSACDLPLKQKTCIRISTDVDTHADTVAIAMMRTLVEKHSILCLNLSGIHDNWHKFWALSFYYDRARDFRLFDFQNPEQSDCLGENLPQGFGQADFFEKHAAFLAQKDQAVDVPSHLEKNRGLVAVNLAKETVPEQLDATWHLVENWLGLADLLVVFGWQKFSEERQHQVLEARLRKTIPGLILVQYTPADSMPTGNFSEILFRQRNSIASLLFQKLKYLAEGSSLTRAMAKMPADLQSLKPDQCFILRNELREHERKLDLIQINTSEGLPWPPEYRPLRTRHPGT